MRTFILKMFACKIGLIIVACVYISSVTAHLFDWIMKLWFLDYVFVAHWNEKNERKSERKGDRKWVCEREKEREKKQEQAKQKRQGKRYGKTYIIQNILQYITNWNAVNMLN